MRNYVFNEKSITEDMIDRGYVDENNPTYTIKNLARYNYYVLGIDEKENYDRINQYMKEHSNIYTEIGYSKAINGCIKDIQKNPFCDIENIIITSEELKKIKQLNDDRQEKIAFVLLADAKYFDKINGIKSNISWISVRDLYKLARVAMPVNDRYMFLSFLYDKNLVEKNYNPKFTGHTLLYVSDTDDDAEMVLTENNYKELAFTYMNWKKGGYKECKQCGRLIKIKGNTQYCKNCAPIFEPKMFKTIKCVDCETDIVVSSKDNKTCRCEDCKNIYRKNYQKELMRCKRSC